MRGRIRSPHSSGGLAAPRPGGTDRRTDGRTEGSRHRLIPPPPTAGDDKYDDDDDDDDDDDVDNDKDDCDDRFSSRCTGEIVRSVSCGSRSPGDALACRRSAHRRQSAPRD